MNTHNHWDGHWDGHSFNQCEDSSECFQHRGQPEKTEAEMAAEYYEAIAAREAEETAYYEAQIEAEMVNLRHARGW